jgi:hypothetical protein
MHTVRSSSSATVVTFQLYFVRPADGIGAERTFHFHVHVHAFLIIYITVLNNQKSEKTVITLTRFCQLVQTTLIQLS